MRGEKKAKRKNLTTPSREFELNKKKFKKKMDPLDSGHKFVLGKVSSATTWCPEP